MSLQQSLAQTLSDRKGFGSSLPETIVCTDENGISCELDLTGVDSMSCAFREMRLILPASERSFDKLSQWGSELAKRVTYLLEHVNVLENDRDEQAVMLRSVPPDRQPEHTRYYEVVVRAPGTLCLRRYHRERQSDERQAIDIQVTQEVLQRLVRDITAAAI